MDAPTFTGSDNRDSLSVPDATGDSTPLRPVHKCDWCGETVSQMFVQHGDGFLCQACWLAWDDRRNPEAGA